MFLQVSLHHGNRGFDNCTWKCGSGRCRGVLFYRRCLGDWLWKGCRGVSSSAHSPVWLCWWSACHWLWWMSSYVDSAMLLLAFRIRFASPHSFVHRHVLRVLSAWSAGSSVFMLIQFWLVVAGMDTGLACAIPVSSSRNSECSSQRPTSKCYCPSKKHSFVLQGMLFAFCIAGMVFSTAAASVLVTSAAITSAVLRPNRLLKAWKRSSQVCAVVAALITCIAFVPTLLMQQGTERVQGNWLPGTCMPVGGGALLFMHPLVVPSALAAVITMFSVLRLVVFKACSKPPVPAAQWGAASMKSSRPAPLAPPPTPSTFVATSQDTTQHSKSVESGIAVHSVSSHSSGGHTLDGTPPSPSSEGPSVTSALNKDTEPESASGSQSPPAQRPPRAADRPPQHAARPGGHPPQHGSSETALYSTGALTATGSNPRTAPHAGSLLYTHRVTGSSESRQDGDDSQTVEGHVAAVDFLARNSSGLSVSSGQPAASLEGEGQGIAMGGGAAGSPPPLARPALARTQSAAGSTLSGAVEVLSASSARRPHSSSQVMVPGSSSEQPGSPQRQPRQNTANSSVIDAALEVTITSPVLVARGTDVVTSGTLAQDSLSSHRRTMTPLELQQRTESQEAPIEHRNGQSIIMLRSSSEQEHQAMQAAIAVRRRTLEEHRHHTDAEDAHAVDPVRGIPSSSSSEVPHGLISRVQGGPFAPSGGNTASIVDLSDNESRAEDGPNLRLTGGFRSATDDAGLRGTISAEDQGAASSPKSSTHSCEGTILSSGDDRPSGMQPPPVASGGGGENLQNSRSFRVVPKKRLGLDTSLAQTSDGQGPNTPLTPPSNYRGRSSSDGGYRRQAAALTVAAVQGRVAGGMDPSGPPPPGGSPASERGPGVGPGERLTGAPPAHHRYSTSAAQKHRGGRGGLSTAGQAQLASDTDTGSEVALSAHRANASIGSPGMHSVLSTADDHGPGGNINGRPFQRMGSHTTDSVRDETHQFWLESEAAGAPRGRRQLRLSTGDMSVYTRDEGMISEDGGSMVPPGGGLHRLRVQDASVSMPEHPSHHHEASMSLPAPAAKSFNSPAMRTTSGGATGSSALGAVVSRSGSLASRSSSSGTRPGTSGGYIFTGSGTASNTTSGASTLSPGAVTRRAAIPLWTDAMELQQEEDDLEEHTDSLFLVEDGDDDDLSLGGQTEEAVLAFKPPTERCTTTATATAVLASSSSNDETARTCASPCEECSASITKRMSVSARVLAVFCVVVLISALLSASLVALVSIRLEWSSSGAQVSVRSLSDGWKVLLAILVTALPVCVSLVTGCRQGMLVAPCLARARHSRRRSPKQAATCRRRAHTWAQCGDSYCPSSCGCHAAAHFCCVPAAGSARLMAGKHSPLRRYRGGGGARQQRCPMPQHIPAKGGIDGGGGLHPPLHPYQPSERIPVGSSGSTSDSSANNKPFPSSPPSSPEQTGGGGWVGESASTPTFTPVHSPTSGVAPELSKASSSGSMPQGAAVAQGGAGGQRLPPRQPRRAHSRSTITAGMSSSRSRVTSSSGSVARRGMGMASSTSGSPLHRGKGVAVAPLGMSRGGRTGTLGSSVDVDTQGSVMLDDSLVN